MTTPARNSGTQTVAYLRKKTTFADGETSVISIGALPKDAIPVRGWATVKTAFNSGTTNTLSVGTSAATSIFASAISVATAGNIAFDDIGNATAAATYPLAADTEVFVTHVRTGTTATAGEAYITLEYLPNK